MNDPLAEEALSILDAEAKRRIDEIRQSVHFICSSLRAQGSMTVQQLLKSVRTLTMDEYCNHYQANTQYFLDEQTRKRKRLVTPSGGSKRRDIVDISDSTNSRTKRTKLSASAKVETDRSTTSKGSLLSTISSTTLQTEKTPTRKKDNQHGVDKELEEEEQKEQEDEEEDEEEDGEEVAFGPLFMQFLRSDHPKVTFQLDPQEEIDRSSSFQLHVPYEFIDQFGRGHRRRIADQIEHLQDQLEILRKRLLEPKPRSLPPSSPSPPL